MVTTEPLVLDASAGVEYLLGRTIGREVAALIAGRRLLAPELLDAEILSVLRQETLRGAIDEAAARDALDRLAALPIERISHRTLIPAAWELRHNVSAYDALYIAVARIYGATLITADGRLARAPALGVPVISVGVE